jgi:hypothetical protein
MRLARSRGSQRVPLRPALVDWRRPPLHLGDRNVIPEDTFDASVGDPKCPATSAPA